MIGQMAVRVTADRANFPLGPLFVRAGSAANVALIGVPVRAGVDVESVTVRVTNVDGASADFAARQYGSVWVVDIPASHLATVGNVPGGVAVYATGTGADGETARTWNIGVGDLDVLPADADAPAPTPGQTFWPLRMFDAAPTAPTKYNAYIYGGELKIWNGTAWIAISGGGETPVAPSTDASAQGKPADAKATGDALAEKRGVANFLVNGWVLKEPVGDTVALGYISEDNLWSGGGYDLSFNNGTWSLSDAQDSWDASAPENATSLTFTDGTSVYSLVRASRLAFDVDFSGKQDALSAAQLANIEAVPGKASAADLRYRIAEAGFKYEFGASAFPITYMNTIASTAVTITAGDAGDITWDVQPDGSAYVSYNGFDFAYFSSTGDYGGSQAGVDLQFNGVAAANADEPLVQILADRTVNLITAGSGTASIDIELPELANVGRMRDFYVRLTVSATSASTWTIGQGESWDAMGSPPSSFAAGTYLYHISEVAAGVWHCDDLFGVLNRIPMYQMVGVTPSSGTLTVTPYTVATYTAGDSAASFEVAVGTGETGRARDCELVIDCTATGAVAPTVTWPATFHPRTDAATDFACEAGKRNVYFISEFASGGFAVGGWQETAGGNAS